MATETGRETSVRRIRPNPKDKDSPYVSLKVIDKIAFVDPKEQFQEIQFAYLNDPYAERTVHIDRVGNDLEVQRIDDMMMEDKNNKFQETKFGYQLFKQGAHFETHKKKIYALDKNGKKDLSIWIEVERVDRIIFVDPKSQFQETVWELLWFDKEGDEDSDYIDLFPVVTKWDNWDDRLRGGIKMNPPWRIDPFQNIVDCSFNYVLIFHDEKYITYGSISDLLNGKAGKTAILAKSGWGKNPIYTSQLKISDTLSPIYTNLKGFSTGIISADKTKYNITTAKFKDEKTVEQSFPNNNEYPIFNGSNSTIYTAGATIIFDEKNNDSITVIDKELETDSYGYSALPWVISANGETYTFSSFINNGASWNNGGVYVNGTYGYGLSGSSATYGGRIDSVYDIPDPKNAPAYYKRDTDLITFSNFNSREPYPAYHNTYEPPEPYYVNFLVETFTDAGVNDTWYIVNVEVKFAVVIPNSAAIGISSVKYSDNFNYDHKYSTNKYISQPLGSPIYTVRLETFGYENVTFTASFGGKSVSGGWNYDIQSVSITENGNTVSSTENPQPNHVTPSFALWPFPYAAYGNKLYMGKFIRTTNYDNNVDYFNVTIYTPYETLTWVVDFNSSAGNTSFDGWMHLSSDKHIIQAYVTGTDAEFASGDQTRHIWVDGMKAQKLLGIDAKSIQAIMIDVSGAVISKIIEANKNTN